MPCTNHRIGLTTCKSGLPKTHSVTFASVIAAETAKVGTESQVNITDTMTQSEIADHTRAMVDSVAVIEGEGTMTNDELLDNIIGFMAFDCGATDSGISDPILYERCKQLVDERRGELDSVFAAQVHAWTSPDSEYGIEDAARFIAYLGDNFNWDCR